ncbi:MAG: preprotein translocase subunit YajC [Eubacteriales bacterium]|nr:preprotein translocase subunit YajC [Eubacteriales bacterium]
MKFLSLPLEAAAVTGGMDWITIAIMIGMFVLLYFFMLRPQKKREKEVAEMRKSIMVGDHITTNGGIVGIVLKETENSLFILSGTQKLEVMRWAVRSIDKKVDETEEEED